VTPRERIVVDTNVLISRLLVPASVSGRALRRAVDSGQLVVSEATMEELATVLGRPKFDPYLSIADRQEFIRLLGRIAEMIPVVRVVRACRDPRDDKFLEVALNGGADLIVTGDRDLLELDPFMGIGILTPAAYLAR
jgi:putative PIN family toxin of toxin-antitoxin system